MLAWWISLKDNAKCGNKLSDVIMKPEKCVKGSSHVSEMEKMNSNNSPIMETHTKQIVSRPCNTLAQLHELSLEDPSRKIVEMIFHKAWMNTSKPPKKVRTVLRVNYSAEVLERFENYREKVKTNACQQYPRHPRSTVDGNELLRFYGTTIRCFRGKNSAKKVYDFCKDPSCCLCQIIQFNFNVEYGEVEVNTSGKELSGTPRIKNLKRAAIVCRVIAGTTENEVDSEYEWSYSNGLGEMQFSLAKFVVQNPNSILPCFVIIFS
ncbi:hypothetical protein TanjilG_19105 [Lupinus angustifolius]|uniref:Uncharacterized protein n=1 Tax=Lupinus angustifolius TaxID=3871 RepID=A0A4P1RRV1_LUPAN|nr:PREDICTED: uncharacterized protein LOC109342106 [Lupinus angustifolius]OIW16389.1 hypothetical protein TanjilG_19105 [Lupinus angustifolius]